jgi:hypothetical protein
MKLKSFPFLLSYFVFNIGISQETYLPIPNTLEPCIDSKRTILCVPTGQKIYLAPSYSLREFTFIEYIEGPSNGIIEVVENPLLKDTFTIWINDAQLKLQGKEPFVKGRKLKAVCTFIQDYDTLIAGGRGSQSGWYALEIVNVNKKFTAPEIISAPAFEKFVKSFQGAGSNCDNNIIGVFCDSATQDTLCVFPTKIRNEIKGTYISKQLKSDIALKVLYNNYKGILQIQLPYPSESSFIYYNQNCWTLPGEMGTIYFPDGSTFEGEIIPARPPKFFKRITK